MHSQTRSIFCCRLLKDLQLIGEIWEERDEVSNSGAIIASRKPSSPFKQSWGFKFLYLMAHEINPLHLLLGSYSFSASSTRNGGRNDSSIVVQRPTESLSNISNLYRVRVCGRLQFPDDPTQTKGWKIFQDYCRCFHFVCTSNCLLRHSSLVTMKITQWLRPLEVQSPML